MPTSLTLYGSTVASTTLSTANKLATTTGGTETSTTTTASDTSGTNQFYMEIWSQGGTVGDSASIPAPDGHGFLLDSTVLEGQTIAAGNWSASFRENDTSGFTAVTMIIRAYKRSSGGTYTSIGSMQVTGQSMSSTTTTYTISATSFSAMSFSTGDKLYLDHFILPTTGHWSGDPIKLFLSNSATAGVANDFQVNTPGYSPSGTQVNKDITLRGKLSAFGYHDITLRGKLSALGYHDIKLRGNIGNTVYKFITVRGKLSAFGYHDITLRGKVSAKSNRDITLRGNIVARNTSGGFTLYGNGTGTVQYDSFRVTQYPDPSLSLAPMVPRVGATSVIYNATIPTNTTLGVDVSPDGVAWTDMTSQNGGSFPGIFSQPDPTIDGFGLNTSGNYTSTSRTGGALGTWTFDTANSRLVATGGTNALYLYSSISRADVDFFADMDQSDAGGLVWRFVDQNNFYYLLVADTLTSTGTKNTVTLYKVAANIQNQLATAAISYSIGTPQDQYTVTFTRGTYHRFRVAMLGSVITVYCDGKQLLTYTDGSPLAAGKMGLYNNGGTTGSRYYLLWMIQVGDYVTGTPSGDIVSGKFIYTRERLNSNDATVSAQVLDVSTTAFTPQISPGVTIPNITYIYNQISKNLDDLAKQSNFSWYVDPNRNFVFRSATTVAAPWILQSAAAGLVSSVDLEVNSDLELDVSNDLYRNRQIITGAQDTGSFVENKIGDGNTRTFTLGYTLASAPTITLNGVSQTVGLKGTTGSKFYYALGDAIIEQDSSGTVLQSIDLLTISYTGLFDIVVIVDDVPEQQARAIIEGGGTGIVEDVEDHSGEGMLKAAAITLAGQLINRNAIAGRTLVFTTTRDGLAVGQTLTIHFPEHGINDGQFYINQVEIKLKKGINDTQVYTYKVTASELPRVASWSKLIASGLLFS